MGVFTRAFRNISRRKMRALLVIIALGFSMAIMISIPAGIVANQKSAENLTENLSNTITTMGEEINQTLKLIECRAAPTGFNNSEGPGGFGGPPSGNSSSGGQFREFFGGMGGETGSYIDENTTSDISSISNVKDVVPILQKSEGTTHTMTRFGRTFSYIRPEYTIVGVPLNSSLLREYSILPTNITSGRPLQEGDTGVVLLSVNNTGYFGVDFGGTVSILGRDFKVVGVHGSTDFANSRSLYMNISDAQALTNLTGQASILDVYTNDSSTTVISEVTSEINSLHPDLSITTASDRQTQLQNMQSMYTVASTSAQSTLAQTQTIGMQEIIVAIVATSLIVLFVMMYTVRERTKEIGTLKAIGFSSWNVMSQFILEGTLLSLVAGAVGIAIGTIAAPLLSGLLLPSVSLFGQQRAFGFDSQAASSGTLGAATAVPDLQTMLMALGLALLLGAVGSLYPAWRASRTRPAEAMRYE